MQKSDPKIQRRTEETHEGIEQKDTEKTEQTQKGIMTKHKIQNHDRMSIKTVSTKQDMVILSIF